ncbi:MAG: hypothetical protein RSC43_00370 [Clostridia bacterium]
MALDELDILQSDNSEETIDKSDYFTQTGADDDTADLLTGLNIDESSDSPLNVDALFGVDDIANANSMIFSDDVSLEDQELYMPQPFDQILDAVDINIAYKTAEVNAYRNEHEMQVTPALDKYYNSAIQGVDHAAFHALIRTIINADGSSVFSKGGTYDLNIYKILKEIIQLFSNKDHSMIPFLEKFSGALKNLEDLEAARDTLVEMEGGTDEECAKRRLKVTELTHLRNECIKAIYAIIVTNPTVDHLNTAIRTVIPKLETLKKYIMATDNQENQYSRMVAAHQMDLENQLEIMTSARDALMKNDLEESEEDIQAPKPTIFRKVMLPAFEGDQRGFRYKCGECGQIHFTTNIPLYINRMSNYKEVNMQDGTFPSRFDSITSQAVELEPVVCPSCSAVNLFGKQFVQYIKAYIIKQMNEGQYRATIKSAVPSTSEINLANKYIVGLLEGDSCTSLFEPEVETVKNLDINPLDEDIAKYTQNFVKYVKINRINSQLSDDIQQRNLRYLYLLYTSKPNSLKNVNDYAAMLTILQTKPDSLRTLMKYAEDISNINSAIFVMEVRAGVTEHMGEVIYKDLVVSRDILNNVNESLRELGVTDEDTLAELKQLKQQLVLMVQQLVRSYDEVLMPIKRIDQNKYKLLVTSGVLGIVWDELKDQYMDMLTLNAALVASRNLSSPLVFGGKCASATQSIKMLNSKLAKCAKLIQFDTIHADDTTAQDPQYEILCMDGIIKGSTEHITLIAVYECIRLIMLAPDMSMFVGLAGIQTKLLSMIHDENSILTPKGLDEEILCENCRCMGEAYDYSCMLEGTNLDIIIDNLFAEEQLNNNGTMSKDDIAIYVYKIAFLFAYCVKTPNKGYTTVQRITKEELNQINQISDAELKRVEDLYK